MTSYLISSDERARLDPYSRIAESKDVPLLQKIADLHLVVKAAKTGMLVTRDPNGNLHSRAMAPANVLGSSQLNLVFLANNVSCKFEEIENDSRVNVSFFDPSSTDWASYSGRARVTQDKELIHKHWSSSVTGYIGNLGDGVHKGDEGDPRIAVIEIIPDEIKYWISKQSSISRTLQVAASAVIGKATAPGELRTIHKEEIQLAQASTND
jgi:general stress protein 26